MAIQLKRLQIVKKLRQLISSQTTGTFFIKTAKHLAVLSIKEGKIISLTFAHLRALQALQQIVKIDSGECSFKSSLMGNVQPELPSSREIIHQIEIAGANVPKHIAPAQKPLAEKLVKQKNFSEDELLAGIADILLAYIGPISSMICDNAASDIGGISSLSDVERLLKILSEDISDSSQQEEFFNKALLFSKKIFQ